MARTANLLILSDVHYAGPAEQLRVNFDVQAVENFLLRNVLKYYRRFVWLKDPFAHNHRLDHILNFQGRPDYVVANGDFSCDTSFIGVSDSASFESAEICLSRLRTRFDDRFYATNGDHEFGKTSLFGGKGGLRFKSYLAATSDLKIDPFWTVDMGCYLLIGITSTLLALPVYLAEALEEDRDSWQRVRSEYIIKLERFFAAIPADKKIILFCHDPTALPFLEELASFSRLFPQLEKTIIGHLHSPHVLWQAQLMAGFPHIKFLGTSVSRMSNALRRARVWRLFRILLCPSLSGLELFHDGGFYTARLDLSGHDPAQFDFHHIPR